MTSPPASHATVSPQTDTRNTLQDLDRVTAHAFTELERVMPYLRAAALRAQATHALTGARMVRDAEYLQALLQEANRLAEGCRTLYRNVVLMQQQDEVPAPSPADGGDQARCQP